MRPTDAPRIPTHATAAGITAPRLNPNLFLLKPVILLTSNKKELIGVLSSNLDLDGTLTPGLVPGSTHYVIVHNTDCLIGMSDPSAIIGAGRSDIPICDTARQTVVCVYSLMCRIPVSMLHLPIYVLSISRINRQQLLYIHLIDPGSLYHVTSPGIKPVY
jgi:hypothetical protein